MIPERVRLCPVHLMQPDDSRNNCWCGEVPIWYVREEECDHDWRVNPHKLLMSNPPRREIVCAKCGKKSSAPTGADHVSMSFNPQDWPKLDAR